jgi:signal recognition particle subunit SEC65
MSDSYNARLHTEAMTFQHFSCIKNYEYFNAFITTKGRMNSKTCTEQIHVSLVSTCNSELEISNTRTSNNKYPGSNSRGTIRPVTQGSPENKSKIHIF